MEGSQSRPVWPRLPSSIDTLAFLVHSQSLCIFLLWFIVQLLTIQSYKVILRRFLLITHRAPKRKRVIQHYGAYIFLCNFIIGSVIASCLKSKPVPTLSFRFFSKINFFLWNACLKTDSWHSINKYLHILNYMIDRKTTSCRFFIWAIFTFEICSTSLFPNIAVLSWLWGANVLRITNFTVRPICGKIEILEDVFYFFIKGIFENLLSWF